MAAWVWSRNSGQMIDPVEYAKAGTEHANQAALFIWASLPDVRQRFPELRLMYAIPNGGARDPATAGRLKAEGVKSGVPDVCLPVARHGCHGLYIELKRPAGKRGRAGATSENQDRWIADLIAEGYGACSCVGWETARNVLVQYLTRG